MLLAEVVTASGKVAATRARKSKIATIAEALGRAEPGERAVVARYLSGSLRQRRTGIGWASLREAPAPAQAATLSVVDVDHAFEQMSLLSGQGSGTRRKEALAALLTAATADEQEWLRAVIGGNLRQGALDALLQEAVAHVAEVPLSAVRRAAMLTGSTLTAADAAFDGGAPALAAIGLEVGRPVQPMLASTAPDVAAAMVKASHHPEDGTVSPANAVAVEAKLDGIRLQAHRSGEHIALYTRSLEDITDRLPEVVAVVRALTAESCVLDGEAMLVGADGRPRAFQETASATASRQGTLTDPGQANRKDPAVTPFFFDLLHLDGTDLLDLPASERQALLADLVPQPHRVARLVTDSAAEATSFLAATLDGGHEGVVVKDLDAPYSAGRRGAAWVKVKPVHTLDLVVLAVERGSGRRSQWLSNIHLGARDPETGGFVMLGKTFKGMTDAMLAWQTERFRQLEVADDGYVVTVRPQQVVEIAFDGVQRSTRYPGGVALRFARVVGYRDDKTPDQSDTIDAVRAHLG